MPDFVNLNYNTTSNIVTFSSNEAINMLTVGSNTKQKLSLKTKYFKLKQ